ncbi:hypothetical protein [Flavivirga algicola]|uniref:Uncharacterized protein n=1 Tax=Flavivirga algicola TaxID=2729136 RepID=A0ABX1RX81_9FLAO|nr:hypothetical protein [Flavivirga algicola]NMH88169.1 hypothetical protein [Flavivirga algicola]
MIKISLNQVLNWFFGLFKANKPLLILMILIDFIFISIHCLLLYEFIDYNLNFFIEKDLGFAEFYQYIKEFGIFLMLLLLSYKEKRLIYLVWALFFLYVLLDDSLSLHEIYGVYLADYFNFRSQFNLRAEDFGELLIFALLGIIFFTSVVFTFFRADAKGRLVTKTLFVLILMLVFFGVFIDLLHIAIPDAKNEFAVIEEGGEMVVMSFIFAYTLSLNYIK